MSEYDTSNMSRKKRSQLPNDFGDECPNCGCAFDAGSSGLIYPDLNGVDVVSWVRVCMGPIPDDYFEVPNTHANLPFCYVHKDEHVGGDL